MRTLGRALLVWLVAAVAGAGGGTAVLLAGMAVALGPSHLGPTGEALGVALVALFFTAIGAALLFPLHAALRRAPLGPRMRLAAFLAAAVALGAVMLTGTLRPPHPEWSVLYGGGFALLTALAWLAAPRGLHVDAPEPPSPKAQAAMDTARFG